MSNNATAPSPVARATSGKATSSTRKVVTQPIAALRDTLTPYGGADASVAAGGFSQTRPTRPDATMAPTCTSGFGTSRTTIIVAAAMLARRASGARDFAIPITACPTTATAAALSPSTQPAEERPPRAVTPKANATRSRAEGMVKPTHAATRPQKPARCRPIAIPTWLDAGPGRNWHSATRSA